jgi:hypothetical protein
MTEQVKILRIIDAITNLNEAQIGVEPNPDPDLGYRMFGGKDGLGNPVKFLSKDAPIQVTTATLTDGTTTGEDGLVRHDTNGLLTGGAITLADLNALISDANLLDKDLYGVDTILKSDSDNTPVALTVPLNTVVGNISGDIDALNAAELWQLLSTDGIAFVKTQAELETAVSAAGIDVIFLVDDITLTGATVTFDANAKTINFYGKDLTVSVSTNLVLTNGTYNFLNQLLVTGSPV